MTPEPSERHLEPDEVAAYVDGAAGSERRAAIQTHLASCAECRAEVEEVSGIVGTLPHGRRLPKRVWIPAAAAAALAVLWAAPRSTREPAPQHREEAVTTTVSPRPVAPVGAVNSARALVWMSVPHADRYRVRLFDADGSVLWEREMGDTIATLPDSVAPRPPGIYFWKVEAHTGFGRWAASDLVEFRPRSVGRP